MFKLYINDCFQLEGTIQQVNKRIVQYNEWYSSNAGTILYKVIKA